jgi:hypothetical protein
MDSNFPPFTPARLRAIFCLALTSASEVPHA